MTDIVERLRFGAGCTGRDNAMELVGRKELMKLPAGIGYAWSGGPTVAATMGLERYRMMYDATRDECKLNMEKMSSPVKEPKAEVYHWLLQLAETAHHVDKISDRLGDSLLPVLAPVNDMPRQEDEDLKDVVASPLVQELVSICRRLMASCNRVEELMSRLQI